MPDDSFFANRPKKKQSLVSVPSGSLPRSPVSFSFSNVFLQITIRSPHPRLGKFVFGDPKRVLQHNPPESRHRSATLPMAMSSSAAVERSSLTSTLAPPCIALTTRLSDGCGGVGDAGPRGETALLSCRNYLLIRPHSLSVRRMSR